MIRDIPGTSWSLPERGMNINQQVILGLVLLALADSEGVIEDSNVARNIREGYGLGNSRQFTEQLNNNLSRSQIIVRRFTRGKLTIKVETSLRPSAQDLNWLSDFMPVGLSMHGWSVALPTVNERIARLRAASPAIAPTHIPATLNYELSQARVILRRNLTRAENLRNQLLSIEAQLDELEADSQRYEGILASQSLDGKDV